MSSLLDALAKQRDEALEQENLDIPHFVPNNIKFKKKIKKHSSFLICLISVISFITVVMAAIWIPSIWGREEKEKEYAKIELEAEIITALRGEVDSDNDGITNSNEIDTHIYSVDSDNDGIADEYENSNGLSQKEKEETLLERMKEALSEEGKGAKSPYQQGGVILWADSYDVRAYSSVQSSINDLVFFDGFSGWARFADGYEAVGYTSSGRLVELDYRQEEQAYYITEDIETVVLTHTGVEKQYKLSLFGKEKILEDSKGAALLAFLLPEAGNTFIKMQEQVTTYLPLSSATKTVITSATEETQKSVYVNSNSNDLASLNYVYKAIDDKRCVVSSIYSKYEGEYKFIIYGYDYFGNLLIADYESKQPIGTIGIKPMSKAVLTTNGIMYFDYFDFFCDGLNSVEDDIGIAFLGVSEKANGL